MLVIAPGTFLSYKLTTAGSTYIEVGNLVGFSNSGASRNFSNITGVSDTSQAKFPGLLMPGTFSATFMLDDGKTGAGAVGGVQYVAFNNLFVGKTPIVLRINFSGDWTGVSPYPFEYTGWISNVSGFSVDQGTGVVFYTVNFELI